MGDIVDYLNDDLPDLLGVLGASDVREIELREGQLSVRLRRAAPVPGAAPVESGEADVELPAAQPRVADIVAPLVGTFYRADGPGIPALIADGSRVEPGTVVGYIDVLGEPTEVEAGYAGTVTATYATDGQPVEYGQALFEVLLGG